MKKFVSLFLLSAILLASCQPEEEKIVAPVPDPAVKVFDLAENPSYLVNEVGTIKPSKEVELVAQASGIIEALNIELGDTVSLNETLAIIDFDEVNDSARLNYDNAQLQLANAQQTLDETEANAQSTVVQAEIRVQSLENMLKRLERNLTELKAQNDSTQTSLELQKNNAVQSAENTGITFDNLEDQFDQSYDDLLVNTENNLDNILFNLGSNFQSVEDIVNPNGVNSFNLDDMNKWLGATDSIQRSEVINDYLSYRNDVQNLVNKIDSMAPLTESEISESIQDIRALANDFRSFFGMVRVMVDNSIINADLTQATVDGYNAVLTGAEASILADVAQLNALSQSFSALDLNRVSQLSTNDNNRVISDNQVAAANNALLNFFNTSLAAEQDLEAQIEQAENDLRLAQADLESSRRNVTIQAGGKNLEIDIFGNQVKLAENALTNNEVTSSVRGVVSELNIDQGDYVSPGTVMGKVIQTEAVEVIFYLSKENADRLTLGQTFSFYDSAARDQEFEGKITKISPTVDAVTKKIMIEGEVDNDDLYLKPEMFVDIELDLSDAAFQSSKVYVPMNAIIFGQNEQYVYVIEDEMFVAPVDILKQLSGPWIDEADPFGLYDLADSALLLDSFNPSYQLQTKFAVKRPVEIGDTFDLWAEITDGLDDNEVLIVEGHRGLEDNQQVMVLNEQEAPSASSSN